MIACLPVHAIGSQLLLHSNLPLGSRSDHPNSTAVDLEAFSTSALDGIQPGSLLFTPMEYSLLQPRSAPEDAQAGIAPEGLLCSPPCPFYTMVLCFLGFHIATVIPEGIFASLAGFGTIHFRSKLLRQVSCYTFLSGFQPSWPPSCYT